MPKIIFRRDLMIEKVYKELIISLHPDFKMQKEPILSLPFNADSKNWIKRVKNLVEKHAIEVTGLDELAHGK